MRAAEASYWDEQFEPTESGAIRENIWKRQQILRRVLGFDLIGKNILEIGVGHGMIAFSLLPALCGQFKYGGLEVSGKQAATLCERGLSVVQADITEIPLPDKYADVVFAFDSLEHVRPSDRQKGYRELARVMKDSATFLIHLPQEGTKHDLAFDHGFCLQDLDELARECQVRLTTMEVYSVDLPENRGGRREYIWVVMER